MEKGVINSIEGDKVHLTMTKEVACCGQGCTDNCNVETFDFEAVNNKGLNLKVGQMVEFTVPHASTMRGLLLVFVIPFGLFFGLYALAPSLGIAQDGFRLLLSLAGLAGGWLLGRLLPKEKKRPIIMDVI